MSPFEPSNAALASFRFAPVFVRMAFKASPCPTLPLGLVSVANGFDFCLFVSFTADAKGFIAVVFLLLFELSLLPPTSSPLTLMSRRPPPLPSPPPLLLLLLPLLLRLPLLPLLPLLYFKVLLSSTSTAPERDAATAAATSPSTADLELDEEEAVEEEEEEVGTGSDTLLGFGDDKGNGGSDSRGVLS